MPKDLCAQHIPYPMHTIAYAENTPLLSDGKQTRLKGLGGFFSLLVLPTLWMQLSRNNSL